MQPKRPPAAAAAGPEATRGRRGGPRPVPFDGCHRPEGFGAVCRRGLRHPAQPEVLGRSGELRMLCVVPIRLLYHHPRLHGRFARAHRAGAGGAQRRKPRNRQGCVLRNDFEEALAEGRRVRGGARYPV